MCILKNCCCCLPLEVGVIVLAILHGIWALVYTIRGIRYLRGDFIFMAIIAFVIVILSIVLLVCVILGMIQKKAGLILIAVFAGIIYVIVGMIYVTLFIVFPDDDDDMYYIFLGWFILLYLFYVYLIVVLNSYRVEVLDGGRFYSGAGSP